MMGTFDDLKEEQKDKLMQVQFKGEFECPRLEMVVRTDATSLRCCPAWVT
jgi:hypothetical protein